MEMKVRWIGEGYKFLLVLELERIEAFVDDLKPVLEEFAKEMLEVGFLRGDLCERVDERVKELAKKHGLKLEEKPSFSWLINVKFPQYEIDEFDVCMIRCSLEGKVVSVVADFRVVFENNRPKVYELEEIRLSVIDNPFEDRFEEEYHPEYYPEYYPEYLEEY